MSERRTIGNTFTVNTVEDGEDAQYIYLRGTARDTNASVTQTIPCVVSVTGGNDVAMHVRGLNLVTINRQTLAISERINYDTYGEATDSSGRFNNGITELISKLNTLDNSVFVCLVSSDAIGWQRPADVTAGTYPLITALQGYGMSDIPFTQAGRYPFLFIGYKNLGKDNGLTRMRDKGNYYDYVEMAAYIANGALTMRDGKDGKDGENSIHLDLDNENDTMLYDGAGNLLSGSVSTMATLYDGGEDVSASATFSIQGYSGMDGSNVSISGRTVTVSGMTADNGYVNVRAIYNGNPYTHKFTLKKIVGVDKFDIVVSPNAVSINTSDTTIADTPINIQVYRTPSNGGARQLVSWTKEGGVYHAYGLTLAVKDGLNNTLTETTSGTPVNTRIFNLTGTMATNTDMVSVTLSKSSVVQDVETIPVSHVRNGQDGTGANAVRIDLSNEMDSIPTDVDGKVLSTVYLTTEARIYNGATPETSGVNAVSVGRIANIQGTVNGSVPPVSDLTDGLGLIQWQIPTNTVLTADKYKAQITFQRNGIPYFANFTAAVVRSGESGVSPEILSLLPTPNQISFPKDNSGVIPVSSKTLSLKIKKTIGNTTEIKEVSQSGLTIKYSTEAMPASTSDGTAWSEDISIPSTATYSNVYIAAFNGSTLVDTETIPIIKDGVDGFDYEIQSDLDTIKVPSGQTSFNTTINLLFFSKAGNSTKQAFSTHYSTFIRRADGHLFHATTSRNPNTGVSPTVSLLSTDLAYIVYIWGQTRYTGDDPESQVYLAKQEIPILKDGTDGQDGARGKVGRFYYFAETFNEEDKDTQFVVNDAQVPYFEHFVAGQKRYHVFNPETTPQSGEMTMAEMWEASEQSWNNAPWEAMTNDFKYLITKAIFAQFAQFGSAIISGDWMLSTNGTIQGTAYNNGALYNNSPAYTWFDPLYPNESVNTAHSVNGKEWNGYNFVPNYAVDLLTGATYQQNAFVKGHVEATSGSFEKVTIKDANFLYKAVRINVQDNQSIAGTYDLYPDFDGGSALKGNIVILSGYAHNPADYTSASYTINLPPAELFPKALVRITNGTMNNQPREPLPVQVKLAVKFDGTGIRKQEESGTDIVTNAMYAGIPFYNINNVLLYIDFYTDIIYRNYTTVEVLSVQVPYGNSDTRYVWMIVNAVE